MWICVYIYIRKILWLLMYMYGIMPIFQSHYHSNKFLVILTWGGPFLVLTFHGGSCGAPYPFRILGFYPSDARFCPHWNERSFAWSGGPMMSHGSKHKENERRTNAMTSHQNHIKSLPRIYQSLNLPGPYHRSNIFHGKFLRTVSITDPKCFLLQNIRFFADPTSVSPLPSMYGIFTCIYHIN